MAFLQGRDHLLDHDGTPIPLPVIRPPVLWVLGVESFKLASLSTLPKIRELLGDWPRHESFSGGPTHVGEVAIRHRLSRTDENDRSDWSRLAVFTYESGVIPEAMRLHGWHCDEPPPIRFLDALMNRSIAGQVLLGFVTMTPIERRFWQPVLKQFPATNGAVEGRRVKIQSSVYDNRALHLPGCAYVGKSCSCPSIIEAEEAVAQSPWKLARLYGDPVDAANTCPFDVDTLIGLREACSPGAPHVALELGRNGSAVMALRSHPSGEVMVWGQPSPRDRMLVLADPSSGMRGSDLSEARHQAGLYAVSPLERRVLARYAGYVTPPELGLMARALCNGYPEWVFVPEMNGGWGEECLRSFMASPAAEGSHGVVYQDVDPTSASGAAAPKMGWWQTANRRGALIAALQRAILERSLGIPSREALENLMQIRLDAQDRYDQPGGGPHALDMILLGMACSIMESGTLVLPEKPEPQLTAREAFERSLGIRVAGDDDGLYPPDTGRWR